MPPGPPRRSARKAAVAAGALFAAGAVFSGAVEDTVRTPRGAVDFASDPGPSTGTGTGTGTLDRTRSPEPARPGQHITLTAVAQLFTPAATATIEYGPPVSGTQIGRDAFGAPDDTRAGLIATPGLDDNVPLPSEATGAVPSIPDAGPSGVAEPPAGSSILTVATPEFHMPAIEVPQHVLNLPGGGTLRTPGVAVSEGRMTPPHLSVARNRDGGLDVTVSDGAVTAPKVEVSDLTGGVAELSPTRVGLPAVRISGGGVFGTTAAAPDMRLSEIRAVLPDVDVPELAPTTDATVPAQRRTSERNENKKSARDAAQSVRSAVGRLLGRH